MNLKISKAESALAVANLDEMTDAIRDLQRIVKVRSFPNHEDSEVWNLVAVVAGDLSNVASIVFDGDRGPL